MKYHLKCNFKQYLDNLLIFSFLAFDSYKKNKNKIKTIEIKLCLIIIYKIN